VTLKIYTFVLILYDLILISMEVNNKKKKSRQKKDKKRHKPHRLVEPHLRAAISTASLRLSKLPTDHPDRSFLRQSTKMLMDSQGIQSVVVNIGMSSLGITSTVGGIVSTVYDIQFSNCLDYASWNVFDEYRIVRVHCRYQPEASHTYDSTATGCTPKTLCLFLDLDDQSSVGSYDSAWKHDNCVVGSSNTVLERVYRMSGGPDDNWITTATANTVSGTFKTFLTGGLASVRYGYFFCRADVEFRLVQ
jgi:hypothetical protein